MSSWGAGGQPSSVDIGTKGVFRPPAPKNARLELVVEGKTFVCRDGSIIGSESDVATEVIKLIPGLEAPQALPGLDQGVWIILTPRNTSRPLRLDGVTLPRGERRPLDQVRHPADRDALRTRLRFL